MPNLDYHSITALVCPRCGVESKGPHQNWAACVDALRSVIGDMQIKIDGLEEKLARSKSNASEPANPARREPKDARFHQIVVLDGEVLRLDVAAVRLGLTPMALYFRIRKRIGKFTDQVDIRAIGADVSQRPWLTARS
jgi:hypothetical protein